jgi:hypothetical protein
MRLKLVGEHRIESNVHTEHWVVRLSTVLV